MRVALAPPPGLVSDETTFAVPGVYEDGSNVRFWMGKPEVIGPYNLAFSDTLTGVCRAVRAWTDNDGVPHIAFGTHSALQVYVGGLYTITPSGLAAGNEDSSSGTPGYGSGGYSSGSYSTPASDYYARTWSLDNWGETLIASPRGGTIYQWSNNTASLATAVTNAPGQCNYVIVTSERQVLALGTNEVGGTYNPRCIRGCDLENLTSWTPSASNNAFEHILEGGGEIVAGAKIGSYVAVWTDTDLHLGQFLGDPAQTYRFDRVADNCGLVSPNSFWVVGQTALWIAPDFQFRIWQPGGQPQILKCPIWRDFRDNLEMSQKEKIAVGGVSKFAEVWFHYPDARDGDENSRYVAFNLNDGTWFRGQLARSAAIDAGVLTHPVMVTPTGAVYYHEYEGGTEPTWHLKTSDQYVDEGGSRVMARAVFPDFEGQTGDVTLTIYHRERPNASASTNGPHTITTATTKKDLRVSGAIMSMKWSGTASGENMRLGKPVFDVAQTGARR